MGLKAALSKIVAAWQVKKISAWKKNAVNIQLFLFKDLVSRAASTAFGMDHGFNRIVSYDDFKRAVPVRDYEGLKPYIDRVVAGEGNVLWPGYPVYLAKTSGTTSGVKYIPISRASLPEHLRAARNALLTYIHETGNTGFVNGKMIFLQGSPVLEKKHRSLVGRLSGIVAHHVPAYLLKNRMPSYAVNCIDDWEEKVDAIVEETITADLRLISGIPPWVQMYFDRLSERAGGKKIKDIFKNFSLFVYGGVNFEPYRARIEESIGKKVDTIETYPASEGFIAYQDEQHKKDLLLLVNAGIFYEFIPAEEYFNEQPTRLNLQQVATGINYALVLSTNAGLWGYSIGDTVKFTALDPYKIMVTGRIKHYISAFGEHVIGEEVESAILQATLNYPAAVTEFTVAPQVNPPPGQLSYHEWFIEFSKEPADLAAFSAELDQRLRQKNAYYDDLIEGKILQPLLIRKLEAGAFIGYMRLEGKLGGQNKVPRLANDRKIAEGLAMFVNSATQ